MSDPAAIIEQAATMLDTLGDGLMARELREAGVQLAPAPDGVRLDLTADEGWRLYNLVSARTEIVHAAEIETRANWGGEPLRLLRRKIQVRLPAVEVAL